METSYSVIPFPEEPEEPKEPVDPKKTVRDLINELSNFDLDMQVVVAYDGRYAHNTEITISEGTGNELFNWHEDPKEKIVILDA